MFIRADSRVSFLTTAWKVSKYRAFYGPYFPVFELNMEIYYVNLRIQSKYRKIRAKKTPYLDTFHAVNVQLRSFLISPTTQRRHTEKKNIKIRKLTKKYHAIVAFILHEIPLDLCETDRRK